MPYNLNFAMSRTLHASVPHTLPSSISLTLGRRRWLALQPSLLLVRSQGAQPAFTPKSGLPAPIKLIIELDPVVGDAPLRLQTFIVSGSKADFGLMMLDPDPLKIDRIHQRLLATPLGPAIVPG